MDWTTLLRMPSTIVLVLAFIALMVTLTLLVVLRRRLYDRRWFAAGGYALMGLAALVLTLLLAGISLALRGYQTLTESKPVAEIDVRILSPQRWALTVHEANGTSHVVGLIGDTWQVETITLLWQHPLLAKLPPLYRLVRLTSGYENRAQPSPTTSAIGQPHTFDLAELYQRYPQWLSGMDVQSSTSAFLPLVEQGHYTVKLDHTGALTAYPDQATEQHIVQPL